MKIFLISFFLFFSFAVSSQAIHQMALDGDIEGVQKQLDSGVNINIRNTILSTPLHLAVEKADLNMVDFLVKNGADLEVKNGGYQNTPLASASKYNLWNIACYLLEKGVKVNLKNPGNGYTPLHHALTKPKVYPLHSFFYNESKSSKSQGIYCRNRLEAVNRLIEKKADVNALTHQNENSLHLAVRLGDPKIVSLILEKGAKAHIKITFAGDTSLHEACAIGDPKVVSVLLSDRRRAKKIINIKNRFGRSPLHTASRTGNHSVIPLLIQAGANVNLKDKNKQTPLHLASKNGFVKVGNLLIQNKANIHARDKRNRAPLHLAGINNKISMARLLIKAGANISEKDAGNVNFLSLSENNPSLKQLINKNQRTDLL